MAVAFALQLQQKGSLKIGFPFAGRIRLETPEMVMMCDSISITKANFLYQKFTGTRKEEKSQQDRVTLSLNSQ